MDRCSPARPNHQWAANLRIVGYAASMRPAAKTTLKQALEERKRIRRAGLMN